MLKACPFRGFCRKRIKKPISQKTNKKACLTLRRHALHPYLRMLAHKFPEHRKIERYKNAHLYPMLCIIKFVCRGNYITYGTKNQKKGRRKRFPSSFCQKALPSIYFAYSTLLNSLITLTFICPGYSSSDSIFFAISLARNNACASSICSGFTITRTSLPAWMA